MVIKIALHSTIDRQVLRLFPESGEGGLILKKMKVFPRRTYTNQDSSVTLRDAGFLPNISLNVHISRHEESPVIDDPNRHLLVTEDMQEPEVNSTP